MSYILDALRKAEHERNIGDAPKLSFAPVAEERQTRPWVLWAIVAVLGITVGILGAMQLAQMRSASAPQVAVADTPVPAAQPAEPSPPPPVPAKVIQPAPRPVKPTQPVQVSTPSGPVAIDMPLPSDQKPAPPKPKPVTKAAPAKPQRVAPEPVMAASPAPEPKPAETESTAVVEEKPSEAGLLLPSAAEVAAEYVEGAETVGVREEAPPAVETTAPAPAPAPAPEPEPEENLTSYNGLPASTRSSIGELAMNAHVYSSTPGRGFVMINGQRYRAGDTLDEGPVLDEIRQEGAVLDYRGQRFLLPVPR